MSDQPLKPPTQREMVLVPRDELKRLLSNYVALVKILTEASTARVDGEMDKLRIMSWLGITDPDKTPARPPSVSDVKRAFETSSEFGARSGVTRPGGYRAPKKT